MTWGVKISIEAQARAKIVRGFSAIFWGMPLALLTSVRCGLSNWLQLQDGLLPVAAFVLIASGAWRLNDIPGSDGFKSGRALGPVTIISTLCAGLSPFILFWNHHPEIAFFKHTITALVFLGLFFIASLNLLLRKLSIFIDEQALLSEIDFFTRINLVSLGTLLIGATGVKILPLVSRESPLLLVENNVFFPLTQAIGLMFFLVPLSLTMTMVWKVKDAFFCSPAETM